MGWFSRWFGKQPTRTAATTPNVERKPAEPPAASAPVPIRLHVFADNRIELNGRTVPFANLNGELKAASCPNCIVLYSRDAPNEDSDLGVAVINCICKLELPIAFPPEARESIQAALALLEKRKEAEAAQARARKV
jgi:hypothetical protein